MPAKLPPPQPAPDPSAHHASLSADVDPRVKVAEWDTLYGQSLVGVAACAPDGRFLRVNRAFALMVGYVPAELEGRRKWSDITVYDDVEPDQAEADAVLRGDSIGYRMAKRYRHKLGHVVNIDMHVMGVTVDRAVLNLIAYVREMRLADHETRVELGPDGMPVLKPVESIQSVATRYWRWLAGGGATLAATLLAGAGAAMNNYYGAIAREQAVMRELTELREGRKPLSDKLDALLQKNFELLAEQRQLKQVVAPKP